MADIKTPIAKKLIAKKLMIVWHSRTGTARALAKAAADGARAAGEAVTVQLIRAEDATPAHMLALIVPPRFDFTLTTPPHENP